LVLRRANTLTYCVGSDKATKKREIFAIYEERQSFFDVIVFLIFLKANRLGRDEIFCILNNSRLVCITMTGISRGRSIFILPEALFLLFLSLSLSLFFYHFCPKQAKFSIVISFTRYSCGFLSESLAKRESKANTSSAP